MFFGHLDGKEQKAGNLEIDGASAMASPRSCSRGWTQGQWALQYIGCVQGFFYVKAQCLDAKGGNACECRNPREGIVMFTSSC
jgi:hypothetical protein